MMAPSKPCTDAHLLPLPSFCADPPPFPPPSFFPDGSLAVAMNFVNKYSMQVLRVGLGVGGMYRRVEGDRGRRSWGVDGRYNH